MAKIDSICYMKGSCFPAVNISDSVGTRGKNKNEDVLLIQAIFNYIGRDQIALKHKAGLEPSMLPEMSGICDDKTQNAIWHFQRKNSRQLLNLDGRIDPASYANRVVNGTKRLMCISLLHTLLIDTYIMTDDKNTDYFKTLVELAPRLRSALA